VGKIKQKRKKAGSHEENVLAEELSLQISLEKERMAFQHEKKRILKTNEPPGEIKKKLAVAAPATTGKAEYKRAIRGRGGPKEQLNIEARENLPPVRQKRGKTIRAKGVAQ